jgi:hypothetical protein
VLFTAAGAKMFLGHEIGHNMVSVAGQQQCRQLFYHYNCSTASEPHNVYAAAVVCQLAACLRVQAANASLHDYLSRAVALHGSLY